MPTKAELTAENTSLKEQIQALQAQVDGMDTTEEVAESLAERRPEVSMPDKVAAQLNENIGSSYTGDDILIADISNKSENRIRVKFRIRAGGDPVPGHEGTSGTYTVNLDLENV